MFREVNVFPKTHSKGLIKACWSQIPCSDTALFLLNTVQPWILELVQKTYPDEEIVLPRKIARKQRQVYVFPACTGKGVRCSVRLPRCPVSAASMEKPLELLAFCFPEASLVQKQLLPDLKISSPVGTKPPECQSSSDLLQLW